MYFSKTESTPQICVLCTQPTHYRVKCRSRYLRSRSSHSLPKHRTCRTWNDITAEICSNCNNKLDIQKLLDSAYKKEDERSYNIFLRACQNFKADKENLQLLFNGFANIDHEIYGQNIPDEIITICIEFCFAVDRLVDKTNTAKFNTEYGDYGKHCEWSCNDTILKVSDPYNLRVYDVPTSRSFIRKIWRIKVLDHDENESMDLQIGLATNVWSHKSEDEQAIRFVDNDIKVGDVITMIYIQDEKMLYAANDKSWHTIDKISLKPSSSPLLMIIINCNVTVQLLQK